MVSELDADVIVVGAGNAAMCAALAANDQGAKKIILLEAAPEDESGGNSRYTAGLFRIPYDDLDQLKRVIPDISPEEEKNSDFSQYRKEDFYDDMGRITQFRANPDLVEQLVERAFGAPYYHFHRADLANLLADALPAGRVRVSHRLVGLEEKADKVVARFENGASAEADVLIGADGIHSKVHALVFGPEKARFTGCVAWRGLVPAVRAFIELLAAEMPPLTEKVLTRCYEGDDVNLNR